MSLPTGARLGPYEILAPLGAGGMGEVYKARDTRLNRIVAIKVLPEHIAKNPEARQRFEREARAVSSLNHPNICVLHDIGQQDGIDFLVMEHLEGETLAACLAKGPLPVAQALEYAVQIADALSQAHHKEVCHRDLKPANIILTKTGAKLLDFGLAKMPENPAGETALTKGLTQSGTILGTLQYMSPEQLTAGPTDARTDMFAFGAVLYEMLTGRKAFEGKSHTSVMVAILEQDPPRLSSLQPLLPPALEYVVNGCLAKDPDERWQTAHDLKMQLQWLAVTRAPTPSAAPPRRPLVLAGWALAAVFLLAAVGLGIAYWRKAPPGAVPVRLTVAPPENGRFLQSLALSPDGRRLTFAASDAAGKPRLWMRSLDSLTAQQLWDWDGGNPSFFFWSHDSRFLAINARGKLLKLAVAGGPPEVLSEGPATFGAWNREGIILSSFYGEPLWRMPAAGGPRTPLTVLDASRQEHSHLYPQFLPDGRRFLYLAVTRNYQNNRIQAGALDSKEATPVLAADSFVGYSPPGYLLFVRGRALLAQPFDNSRLRVSGDPVVLAENVDYVAADARAVASVSQDGVIAYQTSGSRQMQLVWFDRSGKQLGRAGKPEYYGSFRLSPDGARVAVERIDPQTSGCDLWVLDLARGISSRFTVEPSNEFQPVWSPDGRRVAYYSDAEGVFDLYQKPLAGAVAGQPMLQGGADKRITDWSPDGRWIVYAQSGPKTRRDLLLLPLEADAKPKPYLQGDFDEFDGQISPDANWMSYTSNETGRDEVYVQSFPTPGAKWRVSANGGGEARWRRDGKELYFISADRKLMAVEVKASGSSIEAGIPQELFELRTGLLAPDSNQYDITGDGKRFLVSTVASETTPSLVVVLNWAAGLKH